MEQPKKTKQKITVRKVADGNLNGELELTRKEVQQRQKLSKDIKTDSFKEATKEIAGVDINNDKATPIVQSRKVVAGGPGVKTKVIAEDGTVSSEAKAGSDKEKEMLRKLKNQQNDTNKRRESNSEHLNYKLGEENKLYQKKLREQEESKNNREKYAIKVKVKK